MYRVNNGTYVYQITKQDEKEMFFCKSCILESLCKKKKLSQYDLKGTQYYENGKLMACGEDRQAAAIKIVSALFYKKDKKASPILGIV